MVGAHKVDSAGREATVGEIGVFYVATLAAEMLIDGLPAPMHSRLLFETHSKSNLAAISTMEQRLFLGERLLPDTDATSMAASIEVRLPLVDHVLFENVCRL